MLDTNHSINYDMIYKTLEPHKLLSVQNLRNMNNLSPWRVRSEKCVTLPELPGMLNPSDKSKIVKSVIPAIYQRNDNQCS